MAISSSVPRSMVARWANASWGLDPPPTRFEQGLCNRQVSEPVDSPERITYVGSVLRGKMRTRRRGSVVLSGGHE
jgi:hypothetical protein